VQVEQLATSQLTQALPSVEGISPLSQLSQAPGVRVE
jgi:hypothetical protein